MATNPNKKLETLKEEMKAIQEKIKKHEQEIVSDLSKSLIDAQAFDVDPDILIGGILDVIEKAKAQEKIVEVWKEAGQKFRKKQNKLKSTNPTPKIKKAA